MLNGRWKRLAQDTHETALSRSWLGVGSAAVGIMEALVNSIHDQAREMLLRGVRTHAVRGKDDERRILQVYASDELTDDIVYRPINIQEGPCGETSSLRRRGRPEEMPGAMRLPENRDEEIPLVLREQPSRKLAFLARAGDERVAHARQLVVRFLNGNLASDGVLPETPPDLCLETDGPGGELGQTVMRSPIRHLGAVLQARRPRHRHIERDDAAPAPFELVPKRFAIQPVANVSQAHGFRIPLHRIVETVSARKRSRVQGGPRGSGKELGCLRAEPAANAAFDGAAQVRER